MRLDRPMRLDGTGYREAKDHAVTANGKAQ
jgi:hypothetical protein